MERTKDKSVSAMPKALFLAAAILLTVRIIALGATAAAGAQHYIRPTDNCGWTILPSAELRHSEAARSAKAEKEPTESTPALLVPLLAQSSSEKKYLLCEFGADWSDPCKKMESTSLDNPQITKMIGDHFMPIRIRDCQKECGSNPPAVTELYKKYRIFAFPTLVVIDEAGKPVASLIGNCSSLSTYRFLSHALFSLKGRSG